MRRRTKLPSRNSILFNGAAIVIGGVSLVLALKSSLIKEDAEVCSARYLQGTRMSLERNGAPLSADDLQSRLAGTDWGLLDRASVVKVKSGPSDLAMQLDLTTARADDRNEDNGREGVGFSWLPRALTPVNAACLSYSIYLPAGFQFVGGGRLPGLMGTSALVTGSGDGATEGSSPFSMRLQWKENGSGEVLAQLQQTGEGRSLGGRKSGFVYPRGKWAQLEQEVVLNAAGKSNGIVRVWVDGTLRYEKTDVVFNQAGKSKLTGVYAEVVPTGKDFPASAKEQKIQMSPLEVRWNKPQ